VLVVAVAHFGTRSPLQRGHVHGVVVHEPEAQRLPFRLRQDVAVLQVAVGQVHRVEISHEVGPRFGEAIKDVGLIEVILNESVQRRAPGPFHLEERIRLALYSNPVRLVGKPNERVVVNSVERVGDGLVVSLLVGHRLQKTLGRVSRAGVGGDRKDRREGACDGLRQAERVGAGGGTLELWIREGRVGGLEGLLVVAGRGVAWHLNPSFSSCTTCYSVLDATRYSTCLRSRSIGYGRVGVWALFSAYSRRLRLRIRRRGIVCARRRIHL